VKIRNIRIIQIICISVLILFIVSLTGCTKSQEELPIDTLNSLGPKETSRPIAIIRYATNEGVKGSEFSGYYDNFATLLKEKFNIELETNIGLPEDGVKYLNEFYISNNDIFLFNFGYNHAEIRDLIDKNAILPFNDYLAESEYWDQLPLYFRNACSDSYGNIWGIPITDSPMIIARAINKEWLEELNLTPPQTVNELYQMFYKFTYSDPNNSGLNDTHGLGLSERFLRLLNFKDVFEANGCFLSYYYSMVEGNRSMYQYALAGYNPDTGKIENSIYNPGFLDTLYFIQDLIDNKVILNEYDTFYKGEFSNPSIGSHMGIIDNNYIYPDNIAYCYYLRDASGTPKSSVLCNGFKTIHISRDISQPEIIVPRIIDTFYGSEEGYKLARYGLLGSEYTYTEFHGAIGLNSNVSAQASFIHYLGDLSWFEEDISHIDNPEKVPYASLLQSNNVYELSYKNMALLENIGKVNSEYGNDYCVALSRLADSFFKNGVNANDFYEELVRLNNIFNVDQWIIETNQRWIDKE